MGQIGSLIALSDVGCGRFLKAALISGSLNIIINTNTIKDKDYVKTIHAEMDDQVGKGQNCR